MSPWYKRAGVYADFVGSSRFFVSVSEISILLEATLSYAHVLILLLFFFCIFFAFGCCFHVTFISVFFTEQLV